MKLNPDNSIPLYQQLKEDIKNSIRTGQLRYGEKIPTEPELSSQYKVSRITVRRAIEELAREGYLSKKQGKGTFVQEHKIQRKIEHLMSFSEACEANGMVPSSIITKKEVILLSDEQAKEMGSASGSRAVFTQRLRLADGVPIMCENNIFPYERFSFLLNESLDGSLYRLLEEKYKIKVKISTNSFIDVVRASGEIARSLQVSNGEPLFYLHCQIYDADKNLIHIGKQYIISERYRFYLEDYTHE
ncbi:GntR family transcriptional regulator [Anaerosacchariphilus polymeriproducens]|uniref:GntR family transcriptional regulator n=1 Tax=Anaerosacchariphilus polymeriproducens TaxID=1812858 RepID=A0A371AX47_9FIRM|nr:GntR family transcriptional regulator [Anaerosacchariphilus polymeriproducens]RDU24050.1 GntR family transcriptional regulator [Anaerosacchariphilus polymeriproducens]